MQCNLHDIAQLRTDRFTLGSDCLSKKQIPTRISFKALTGKAACGYEEYKMPIVFLKASKSSVQSSVAISAEIATYNGLILTATVLLSRAASGQVLTCGDNSYGQLGYRKATPPGDISASRSPQTVVALNDVEVVKLACGDVFTIACCKGEHVTLSNVCNTVLVLLIHVSQCDTCNTV